MPTNYQITIKMSDQTASDLFNEGYFLYGFKGVKSTTKSGAPLVWFQSQTYSQNTLVNWDESYQAYTSRNQIIPNGGILASASYDIDLGQRLLVTDPTGVGSVDTTGTPHAITITNQTSTQFTCGISQEQKVGGTPSTTPLCAFPLHGSGSMDVMEPIEKVLLTFATQEINTGTVIEQSFMPGLLVDLTDQQSRTVTYDINLGWSWDGGTWAQPVPSDADLTPLLVLRSSDLSSKSIEVSQRRLKRAA